MRMLTWISTRLLFTGLVLAIGIGAPHSIQARPIQRHTPLELREPLPPEREEAMALRDTVLRALERNLDISMSRQTKKSRLTDILFERAKFDPTVNLSGTYQRNVTPLNRPILGLTGSSLINDPQTLDQNDTQFLLDLSQTLWTGTEYSLSYDPLRTSVAGDTAFLFNPSYSSDLLFTLTQPLLRDFGPDIIQTQVRIAQNNAQMEEHTFFETVLTIISTVEQGFWELVFAREDLEVARTALTAAKALEASNRAKAKAGIMAIVEVLQAEAAVANRVEQVLIARKGIQDQEDQLRQLLNPEEDDLRQTVRILPTDDPTTYLQPISLQAAIDTALDRRPEVLRAQMTIATSALNVKFSKNQLLPSLSLQGNAGLKGLGKDFGDMVSRDARGDFYTFGGGLVLSFPLGNRSAQSQYNKRQLEARNAQASLQRARQQVIINVRAAVRRVQTDFQRIETTRSARILAEKQLLAEQERLNVGLSTTRLVLDFQRDLAIAQRNELRAIIDYNNSLSNFALTKGTTLEGYGIRLE